MTIRQAGQIVPGKQNKPLPASVCPDPSWPFGARTEECDLFDAMPLRERARVGLPLETGFFDFLGKALYVSFAIAVFTGIGLLAGYRPTVDGSFRSVEHLQSVMSGGWWLRGLHKYATDLFVIFAILRLCRLVYRRAYKFPGDLSWLAAVGVLLIGMISAITGYILVWNQNAILSGFPEQGQTGFGDWQNPGTITWNAGINQQTLTAVFLIHIALSILFLLFIIRWRLAARRQAPRYKDFQPKITAKLVWTLIGILTVLAMFAPPPLGSPIDRGLSPSPVFSDWFALGWYRVFGAMPSWAAKTLLLLSLGAVILFPWLDRIRNRGPRPIITAMLAATILTWLIFTVAQLAVHWPIGQVLSLTVVVWIIAVASGVWGERGLSRDTAKKRVEGVMRK